MLNLLPRVIEKLKMHDILTLPNQNGQLSVCESVCVCTCVYMRVVVALGIKFRSSYMVGECSTTELHLQLNLCVCTHMHVPVCV